MNRAQLKDAARAAIVKVAPELSVVIAEKLIEAPVMQRWFDRVERSRPRGLVALVRRLRGRRGLNEDDRRTLEKLVEQSVQKYR
jgi:hypothetical protein